MEDIIIPVIREINSILSSYDQFSFWRAIANFLSFGFFSRNSSSGCFASLDAYIDKINYELKTHGYEIRSPKESAFIHVSIL